MSYDVKMYFWNNYGKYDINYSYRMYIIYMNYNGQRLVFSYNDNQISLLYGS